MLTKIGEFGEWTTESEMKTLISVGIILTVLALAQSQQKEDLDGLSEKISSHLESKLPGWQHRRLPPFGTPESKVVVQVWSIPNRIVKVAVAVRGSVEDAKKEIRSFLQFRREPQELTGFGDEAFWPERNGDDLVLRKGRYVIYLSIVVYVEEDSDAQNLTKAEQQARTKADTERILKEFARQFSAIELE